jgi:hypothetical protein
MEHVVVYRKEGRYCGWPANYGIWSWGDEIVVGFTFGYVNPAGGFHAREKSKPFIPMQARSTDGGKTWEVQDTPASSPGNRGFSADEHMVEELGVGRVLEGGYLLPPPPGGINFTHPDFALMCARAGLGVGATPWFYISYDRCRRWEGPFALPMFDQVGVAARTDYLVSGPRECTLFLTAVRGAGRGARAFCSRTTDSGKTFQFLSWIAPDAESSSIMPANVRLSDSRILVAVRCRQAEQNWIDLYGSEDNGATWHYMNRPAPDTGPGGNPPTLTKLLDGRICLTYGFRGVPHSMRARLSNDEGATWKDDIVLRDDGGNHDIGYPRTVQRRDGTVVTVYYFNDEPDGERYIAATLWACPPKR